MSLPAPYYKQDRIVIYHGDCREILPYLPKVDLVLTDPPYGIGKSHFGVNRKNDAWKSPPVLGITENITWDKRIDREVFTKLFSISCNQIIWGGNYYTDYLYPTNSWVIWNKKVTGNYSPCEMAWTSYNKPMKYYEYLWNGYKKQIPEKRYHPTQKPLSLMKWVVEEYSHENDTIIDPFMGSGTTLVAAKQLGRKAIGIEIEEKYCEIAVKRLGQGVLPL